MFFDTFSMLCEYKGVSRYKACTDIGLNRAAVAKWKNGSIPTGATLTKLSGYFDVTADYLLGNVSPEFARRVELLKRRNISYKELSQETGISASRLKRYFMKDTFGETDFYHEFPRLARALGVSPQYLFCLTDQESDKNDTDEKFRAFVMGFPNEYENTNTKKEPAPTDEDGYSEIAKQFMGLVDRLTPDQQQLLLAQLQAWTEQNQRQAPVDQQADG